MAAKRSDVEMFLLRVGDAEREECIQTLTDHHVQGRLSVAEFDRRHRTALKAATAADLAALLADLPATPKRRGHHPSVVRLARKAAWLAVPPVAVGGTALPQPCS